MTGPGTQKGTSPGAHADGTLAVRLRGIDVSLEGHLFRFAPAVAAGVATAEPHGATRWRF